MPPFPGARLVTAHDAERERLARHLGSACFEWQFDFDKRSYGYSGRDIAEALRSSPHAEWFVTSASVTCGMVDVMGTMLERACWTEGLQLSALGLDGLDVEGVRRFALRGER